MSFFVFFFKQKTAYEMRISDWSSDVCSSDLFLQRRLYPTDWRQTPPSVRPADPFSMARTQRRERADLSQRVARPHAHLSRDRKSVVSGKSVSVRVDLGGRRIIKKYKRTI